jgi:hypothetical protein
MLSHPHRMPTRRALVPIVLYGGWLLLFNPVRHHPEAPLSTWDKVDDYDTAYACQEKLREKIATTLAKEAKDGHAADGGARMTATEAQLRYRCERVEHVPPQR